MKLKKIASLMLAGIMAVSMLAACGEGKGEDNTPAVPETPVSSSIVDAANAERTDYMKNSMKLSFTESSALTDALTAAVGSEFKTADIKGALTDTDFGYAAYQSTGAGAKVATKVFEKLTGTSNNNVAFAGMNSVINVGTKKSVVVYAVGGKYDADDAAALVSKSLGQYNMTATGMPISATGTKADYTANIAAVKATSAEDSSLSIWVVAVEVTQTVVAA